MTSLWPYPTCYCSSFSDSLIPRIPRESGNEAITDKFYCLVASVTCNELNELLSQYPNADTSNGMIRIFLFLPPLGHSRPEAGAAVLPPPSVRERDLPHQVAQVSQLAAIYFVTCLMLYVQGFI